MSLLEVTDLDVRFLTRTQSVHAVRGLSFDLDSGRTLALVGESGSGKSVTATSLPGLLPKAQTSGRILFRERNLVGLPERQLRGVRGAEIGMVFQNPFTSLHPAHRIGDQIAEIFEIHKKAEGAEAKRRAVELLDRVGIADPEMNARRYPHEFSGGMLQRAMIAMAVALKPDLLIADEPTTALDVTVQSQILGLLKSLQRDSGMAILFVTHDLSLARSFADDVLVMYGGRLMERAPAVELFNDPRHPYTRGLLNSLPVRAAAGDRLEPIPGQPASAANLPDGCPFHPRCPQADETCHDEPPVEMRPAETGTLSCWHPEETRVAN